MGRLVWWVAGQVAWVLMAAVLMAPSVPAVPGPLHALRAVLALLRGHRQLLLLRRLGLHTRPTATGTPPVLSQREDLRVGRKG